LLKTRFSPARVFSLLQDAEAALLVRHQSRAWCWCMCLGLALMLSGVVVGGAYLYRYYVMEEGQVFFCGVNYREEDFMIQEEEEVDVELPNGYHLRQVEERIRVLEREQVELINVPVPEFEDGDPADIAGTYLPQSYLVREEMMVTERLEHVDQLGFFINNLCNGKDTYKLQRRDRILGMQKREALNCRKIRHFGSAFVVETVICEP
uniref:Integral membrane protein 2 n=1 Tax=Amphilophus citrinellus TaxID=61819 RepID=A0A3Q0R1J7_AMPCI